MKTKLVTTIICGSLALAASATTVTVGTTTPSVGAGVEYLGDSGAAGNVSMPWGISTYVAGDNNCCLGQTFTTGANAGGYFLTSISFMQVANSSTWDSMNGLGSQGIRLFQMGNGITAGNPYNSSPTYYQSVSQILDSETIQYPTLTSGGNFFNSTPGTSAWWVTVTFGAPISLQANTQYGFDLQTDGTGGNGDFFMEWNGTSTAGYGGGEAFVDGANGNSPDANITTDQGAFLGYSGSISGGGSHTFVAAMQAVPEPSALALMGLGGLAVLLRRRSA